MNRDEDVLHEVETLEKEGAGVNCSVQKGVLNKHIIRPCRLITKCSEEENRAGDLVKLGGRVRTSHGW